MMYFVSLLVLRLVTVVCGGIGSPSFLGLIWFADQPGVLLKVKFNLQTQQLAPKQGDISFLWMIIGV